MKLLVVMSASMGSALPTGSLAFVAPQEEYAVGDIVTFEIPSSGELLTHRVVGVSDIGPVVVRHAAPPLRTTRGSQLQADAPRKYKTQGDANNVADDWELTDADIVGKVVFHLPYLGYLFRLPQIL